MGHDDQPGDESLRRWAVMARWVTNLIAILFLGLAASVVLFGSRDERWIIIAPVAVVAVVVIMIGRVVEGALDDISKT
jgi:fatty acid desaturase